MTLSAHDVAAELRARLPGLGQLKLHKLLYYCQGFHLATFGVPLFSERINAWDKGPVVEALWREERYDNPPFERAELDEAALNTIGYVHSRYGASTGTDLMHMSHAEEPYRFANATRQPGTSSLIRQEWMRDYFRGEGAPGVGDDELPIDSDVVSKWLREAAERKGVGREDTLPDLDAWAARGA